MAKGGFIGSLGLLVLLCSVSSSTQQSQDKSGASRSGFQPELEERSAQAAANALAQSHGVGHPAPITTPWPWPTTPYYPPYTTPAPVPPSECVYPDQVIYERDVYEDCLVCVCVQRYPYNYLDKVCGRCSQCPAPVPPTPPPPPPTTTTPPPPPPPPPTPKCDPFPTNQWFQNPIDPCQLCLCSQANPLQIPVIECQHNPQCVQPVTTEKPKPGPPVNPEICNHYPLDIFFPHPTYPCYICKCEQWPYKPKTLECAWNPACEPTPPPPPPVPTTTIAPPTPPPEPPTPWVDPLPGPGPHPSCRPFVPNQIFQHPWDPCLACVCTESQVGTIINLQVNCFTKAECCIIPPGPEPTTPYYPPIPTSTYYPIIMPHNGQIGSSANANAVVVGGEGPVGLPSIPGSSLVQADAAAEAAAQAQAAAAQAQAAAEAVQANYINQYPYIQPSQAASAQALAQAQANQALGQALSEANAGANRGYYSPNRISPGGYANANANALVNTLYQQPSYYPGIVGGQAQADSNAQAGWGSANAQADALAQGNGQAQADAQAQSNSGYGASGWSPVQDALAQAQANAQNALYAAPQQVPISPYGYGGLGSSLAQAQADAEAESGRGSAQAAANALAQEMAAQAQAAAQASANSQQLYQSQPNPIYYSAPRGPSNVHPLDINALRANGEAEAQAQAEASANSNRGEAAAQAQASAAASALKSAEASAQAQASAAASALKSADSDADADSQY